MLIRSFVLLVLANLSREGSCSCTNSVTALQHCSEFNGAFSSESASAQRLWDVAFSDENVESTLEDAGYKTTSECKAAYTSFNCAYFLQLCDAKGGKVVKPCRSACVAQMMECDKQDLSFETAVEACRSLDFASESDEDCAGFNRDFSEDTTSGAPRLTAGGLWLPWLSLLVFLLAGFLRRF
mmetsp:Transcript_47910/g.94521  ORF Transcript_47910/g.94521 Transcript_47910/m.94521 type:complete len:182 (+) Transcript_47910:119-664(+)